MQKENKVDFKDIIDIDKEIAEHGNLLCFIAGTGSGKSSWVKEVLAQKGKVLFITSRKAKVLEDENNSIFVNNVWAEYPIVTNSRLAKFLKSRMNFYDKNQNKKFIDEYIDRFDYIVIDEVHALACDATFQNEVFIVQKFIEYAGFARNKNVIALSATIEPVKDYIENSCYNSKKWYIRDLSDKCHFVLPKKCWIYDKSKIDELIISCKEKGTKFIYFSNRASYITETLYDKCINAGISKEDIFVSFSEEKQNKFEKKYKDTHEINLKASTMMEEKVKLPENFKVVLSTSKLKEGISITNQDILCMFCESHYLPDIIQYMGRLRDSKGILYIIKNSTNIFREPSEMEYNFCCQKDTLNACNKYFEKLQSEQEKKKFISFIEDKFKYISFNYFTNEFATLHLKYRTQLSQYDCRINWEEQLSAFFDEHPNIDFQNLSKKKENIKKRESYKFILKNINKEFIGEEQKDILFKNCRNAFDLKGKRKEKLNREFESKKLKYKIVDIPRVNNLRGVKLIEAE